MKWCGSLGGKSRFLWDGWVKLGSNMSHTEKWSLGSFSFLSYSVEAIVTIGMGSV